MTETASQLLAAFESLPGNEQHELLVAMLRRSGELPDAIVADDQLTALADDLFRALDAEEADGDESDAGDVWLVDLGMAAKIRPCLVISIPATKDNDRLLTTLVPHTTSVRGSRFEVRSSVSFLKTGAFDAQNIVTIPSVKLIRKLGSLPGDQMAEVQAAVA